MGEASESAPSLFAVAIAIRFCSRKSDSGQMVPLSCTEMLARPPIPPPACPAQPPPYQPTCTPSPTPAHTHMHANTNSTSSASHLMRWPAACAECGRRCAGPIRCTRRKKGANVRNGDGDDGADSSSARTPFGPAPTGRRAPHAPCSSACGGTPPRVIQ